jgi:ABC-type dipeptide/oligopeptide/nickel transport system ATPase component
MICIAHNLELLRELCDSILIIYNGEIVESGRCDKIFTSPENDYTKYLLKAEKYELTIDELKFISGSSDE